MLKASGFPVLYREGNHGTFAQLQPMDGSEAAAQALLSFKAHNSFQASLKTFGSNKKPRSKSRSSRNNRKAPTGPRSFPRVYAAVPHRRGGGLSELLIGFYYKCTIRLRGLCATPFVVVYWCC